MDACSKIIILDGEHSIPNGNLNKKLSALRNRDVQGKKSHCSEVLSLQTGGVVSLNLFQPLIETEGEERTAAPAVALTPGVLISTGSGYYSGFVLPFRQHDYLPAVLLT